MSDPEEKSTHQPKYIAVKVEGIKHWFWFQQSKVDQSGNRFVGSDGWGDGAAFTNLNVAEDLIVGTITSDKLQCRD